MRKFDVHRIFYGHRSELSNHQIRVYGSSRIRAISTAEADTEKAKTALVLALAQAFDPSARAYVPVILFTPKERVDWLCVQAHDVAKDVTLRLKAEITPENKDLTLRTLRILREWISNVRPGTTEEWMSPAPEKWAAFGYTEKDNIPSWLKVALG